MNTPIVFHFDFSSPYGYIASERIETLAARHGRSVDWRPMLLGAVFKIAGTAPLTSVPLKGDYSRRDIARSARFHGVPFQMPPRFPIATQAPARIVVWQRGLDAGATPRLVKAFYRAYFVDGRDISDPEVAAEVAAETGIDRAAARAAIDDPAVKDALRRDVDAAIVAGVFGSPYIVVDGEPFWGADRFDQIDRWLERGEF
ncbi:MAG TPA: 2-hydroxychromene-2-carboxylate isomerase [Casimicrobiaceae bacterium]|nr:2-hydroxychromene-2-carboxylate isomerase [Casimicrobiaceae bacterium]